MKNRIAFLGCLLLILGSFHAAAQREPVYTDVLIGDSIRTGKTLQVKDSAFYDAVLKPTIKHTYFINNLISLRINEDLSKVLPDSFALSVKLKVVYVASDTLSDSIPQKTLSINYNKNRVYDNKSIFYFRSAHFVKVEILEITSTYADTATVLPLVLLENRMVIERIYDMSCTNDAIGAIQKDTGTVSTHGELKISWTPNNVSQYYDVEWTYIDKSALDNGRYTTGSFYNPALIFKNNATRISTKADTCMIPLLYDGEGFLFYRVRGAQIDQNGEVLTTQWSSEVDTATTNWRYYFAGHERGLNWQASTTFAEEGKRKSVVSYFDGSLRGRQVVTRDNTTQTTVVAETLYDKQGRPVIQVMPAPTLSTLIKYTPLFNVKDMNGAEYDKGVYDTLLTAADYCGDLGDSMSVKSGAANYYSVLNPLKNESFHQFIPDAHGYAFSQTQYTQDNTGRIDKQSGVDSHFKMGSGKETRYFYGNAQQEELDALFGTEVGYASHYQKNMVRDANGQYSVSYVDMHGRTIATALAGAAPAGMDTIRSYRRDSVETRQLLSRTNNVLNGNSVEHMSTIFMTKADSVTLHYTMGTQSLTLADCKANNICYDCLYDLTISVVGDCSGTVSGKSDTVIRLSNFPLWRVDTTCDLAVPIDKTIRLFLQEGSYNITKTLSISQQGMDFYRDSVYLPRNTCKSYDSIYRKQMAQILDSLDCSPDTLDAPMHGRYREQMLADLYPLTGQYADTVSTRSCFSIFDKINGRYYYQAVADTGFYLDEQGLRDSVLNSAGQLVPPQSLTPDEFISNFRDSWADNLLSLHPEYCLLQQYLRFTASHEWDEDFEKTETFAEALSKGYLNPTGNTTQAPANNFPVNLTDPLYSYSFATGAKAAMEDSLFHYRTSTGNPDITVWGLATAIAKCAEPMGTGCLYHWNGAANSFNDDSLCTGELDMAWRIFRSIYLAQKREWVDKFIHAKCAAFATPKLPCVPVFPRRDSLLQDAGFPVWNGNAALTAGQAQADSLYLANCNGYAERWREQLGSCYTEAQKDSIIYHLVNVCKEGADQQHPFGSSTVKPGSTYLYQSFAAVISHFNQVYGVTDTLCNAYLIDRPLPYNHSAFVVQQPVWNKPDSCTCEKIDSLYTQYQQTGSLYSSFSNYIEETLHTTISNASLDSLRGLCNGTVTCKFLANPITVPPALQCGASNVCITCPEFQAAYADFAAAYPSIVPTMEEPDTVQQLKNRIFANYLNQQFGFSETAQGYLSFKQQCDNFSPPVPPTVPDTSLSCENLQLLAQTFNSYVRPYPGPVFDSSGCNVSRWRLNDGGWEHNYQKYRWLDFLQSGIVRQPVTDTINRSIDFNYVDGGRCIDGGVSVEARVRFPIDSARRAIYVRNGGNASAYGRITYNFNCSNQHIFTVTNQNAVGLYQTTTWHNPPPHLGTISYNHSDSNLWIDYSDWRIIKFKQVPGRDTIFLDGTPIITYANHLPLGTFTSFAINPAGYDLEIDWIKFYDKNDSLRMHEDFEDCEWAPSGFDTACLYDCQYRFAEYVNRYTFRNLTYSEIMELIENCNDSIQPCIYKGPLLCGKNEPLNELVNIQPAPPCADSTNFAITAATQLFQIYRDSLIGHFNEAYTRKCLAIAGMESLTITRPVSEYHYTLYYYDLAGNLVKTVPPEGVKPNRDGTWLSQVASKRAMGEEQVPAHTLPTVYRYNSLNQVVSQKSPDGGRSEFWYDRLGRLVVSQNAKQRAASQVSYTKYDAIGRITEVGQKYTVLGIDQAITRNQMQLEKWLNFRNHDNPYQPRQVTRTMYDEVSNFQPVYDDFTPFRQRSYTLRNRVSTSRYYDQLLVNIFVSGGDTAFLPQYLWFNTGIEYSYDIHGNVDSMLNIAYAGTVMNSYGHNAFKLIAYKYDLISGKVNEVHYQPGSSDEFYHRYEYDADNRLTDVYTTDNKAFLYQQGLEEHDAHYRYYKHGPLARMVLGQQQVQGVDYAYTLQGWLKGVNSTSLNADHDMGQDGKAAGINPYVAGDVYGFNLNYFTGEYSAISGGTPFPGHSGLFSDQSNYRPLYNGNISSMAVNIGKFNQPQLYNYKYDQLNRIVSMDVFRGLNQTNNTWNSNLTPVNDYKERVSYDGNGNILKYLRNGPSTQLNMDSLSYHYNAGTNQLNHVRDQVWVNNYTVDVDNQSVNNYSYDQIGNLTADNQAGVYNITWNVYGKLIKMNRYASAGEAGEIHYKYDPSGNRVGKTFYINSGTAKHYWYVRDAQGNVMAVYEMKNNADWSLGKLKLIEHHMYGSSRLGIIGRDQDMDSAKARPVNQNLIGNTWLYSQQRGEKVYELSNHLGNVLVAISDKKIAMPCVDDGNPVNACPVEIGGGPSFGHFEADVVNASDYYPFGMLMPGRKYSASDLYRYGFNGKENDNEVKGEGNQQDYGMRIYDPRLGKFLSVDPLTKDYPWYTPYQFAGNMPIWYIDVDGAEPQAPPSYWERYLPMKEVSTGERYLERVFQRDNDRMIVMYYEAIYDKTAKQYFFVSKDPATAEYYYWKHKDGADPMRLIYSTTDPKKDNGYWASFKPASEPNPADLLTAMTVGPLVAVPGLLVYGEIAIGYLLRLKKAADKTEDPNSKINDQDIPTEFPEENEYVSVFHKGELNGGEVKGPRPFSAGRDKESVEALDRPGKVWEFRIPRLKLKEWERDGLVTPKRDLDYKTGTYNDELQFDPSTFPELNKTIIK